MLQQISEQKKEKIKHKKLLNADQENFCQLFVTPDTEFYGSGVQSYLKAYSDRKGTNGGTRIKNWKYKELTYDVAKVNAYKLLTKAYICERINQLLEQRGFNDQNVDKQHLFLINQFADLKSKLGAIRAYNELKKRVEEGRGDVFQTIIFANGQINKIARRVLSRGESSEEESN